MRYSGKMFLRIAELRAERKWTQETLARKAGVSRSYLSELENETKPINIHRLRQIAEALNVEMIALFDLSQLSPTFQRLLAMYLSLPEAKRLQWADMAERMGEAFRPESDVAPASEAVVRRDETTPS